jgi:hypothetical protein
MGKPSSSGERKHEGKVQSKYKKGKLFAMKLRVMISISTLMLHPHNILNEFIMGPQREKIMRSEGGFYGR